MTRAITCTTREPRPGEKDGVDYYFLDAETFLSGCRREIFWNTPRFTATATARLKSEVLGKLRQGKDVLLNVDVQGAATIRERAQEDPELKTGVGHRFS